MVHHFEYIQKLTNVLNTAKQDGKLKIGFIGGSITQGCNPSLPENAYVERVTKWFKEKFPNMQIESINAGVGATGSLIGVHRVERDIIAYKPDLVFVEFAANDVSPKQDTNISYESLIRKLVINLPDTAIVEIFMTLETGESAEEEEAQIARHYHIPTVSYRQEVFRQMKLGSYTWKDIETDEVHPNDKGHGIVAGLIAELMEAALSKEAGRTFDEEVPKASLFGVPYIEGDLIEFKDLKILESVGFEKTEESFRTINTGYAVIEDADEARFTCEVEGKNVFLLYVNGIEENRAEVEIQVNGKSIMPLDTFFENGWGNYPETYPLFSSDAKQKVTIEIKMPKSEKGKKLNLLGFLVS